MSTTRVLVTGGGGFVGSNLVRAALARGAFADIRVIDDFSVGLESNLDGCDVEVIRGSILDPSALHRAMADRDAVVHLAALPSVPRSLRDPMASHAANATGTLAVLDAARHAQVGHVIVASSSSVYGSNPALPKSETDWTRPLSPYSASKLATEAYALAFQSSFGLPALAFRFFNIYGPGQRHDHAYAAVIPRFAYAALVGEPLTVHGDGGQSRDFTYVETVCQVLIDAVLRRVAHPQPVNLAFGTRTDLRTVLDELRLLVDRPLTVRHESPRPGDVRHSQADNLLLRELFPGIRPAPFADGLRHTVDWLRSRLGPLTARVHGEVAPSGSLSARTVR